MAFNPSPKVAAARDIGNKFHKPMVIVIMLDPNAGTMEYASYGQTAKLCGEAEKLADVAYEAIYKHLEKEG
jgi:hypothetical protein